MAIPNVYAFMGVVFGSIGASIYNQVANYAGCIQIEFDAVEDVSCPKDKL